MSNQTTNDRRKRIKKIKITIIIIGIVLLIAPTVISIILCVRMNQMQNQIDQLMVTYDGKLNGSTNKIFGNINYAYAALRNLENADPLIIEKPSVGSLTRNETKDISEYGNMQDNEDKSSSDISIDITEDIIIAEIQDNKNSIVNTDSQEENIDIPINEQDKNTNEVSQNLADTSALYPNNSSQISPESTINGDNTNGFYMNGLNINGTIGNGSIVYHDNNNSTDSSTNVTSTNATYASDNSISINNNTKDNQANTNGDQDEVVSNSDNIYNKDDNNSVVNDSNIITTTGDKSKEDNDDKKGNKENHKKGKYENKKVYLTFDDGPSKYTDDILDLLAEYDAKASFFVIGKTDKYSKKMYQRILEEGHTLGMHSYTHKYEKIYNSIEDFEKDFTKLFHLLYDTTGYKPLLFRFPGGSANSVSRMDVTEIIRFLNNKSILYFDWNVDSQDAIGVKYTKEEFINNILSGIEKKVTPIVLMHDTESKETTLKALPDLLEKLVSEGAKLLPLDEEVPPIQQIKASSVK
jgi:peptidoglycan/xylan/chitin deacetylase (PgdA/CDA1 family)